jgi:hypothetical protein
MTFKAVEDRPTPKEVYNWRLYFEASVIATGSLLYVLLVCSLPVRVCRCGLFRQAHKVLQIWL